MRKSFVPHTGQAAVVTGEPLALNPATGSFISRFSLHFMQYASINPPRKMRFCALINNGVPNTPDTHSTQYSQKLQMQFQTLTPQADLSQKGFEPLRHENTEKRHKKLRDSAPL
jgi:hypothetical protein